MNVLERIDFECEASNDVNGLFSKDHVKYDCVIRYNGKDFSFTYQCNPKYSQPTKENCIGSLLSDASCFECSSDFEQFCDDLGYTKISEYKKAQSIYNACGKVANFLSMAFTDEEREELDELLENYR